MAKLIEQPTWSGILDTPQDILNPDFFETSGKLKKEFRDFALQKIEEAEEEYLLDVRAALFYGGSASYQWSKSSDIDISLYVNWEGDIAEYEQLQDTFKSREFSYLGYPFHMFLKPLDQKEPIEVSEAVYDIIQDKWIAEPQKFPKGFDPLVEYSTELVDSEKQRQQYAKLLDSLESNIEAYKKNQSKELKLEIVKILHQVYTAFIKLRKDRDLLHEELRALVLSGGRLGPYDRFKPAELTWKYLDKHGILGTMKEIFLLVKQHQVNDFLKLL